MNMKKIIIMIGPPGSGKGTQAKKIAQKYNYAHLSSGDLLRVLAQKENLNDAEKEALIQMQAGRLVADDLIYQLVFSEIKKNIVQDKGVVLDGAIRNLEQARAFQKFFAEQNLTDKVLVLEINLNEKDSLARLTKRQILEARQDDEAEIIGRRIVQQGNAALAPIAKFYEDLGVLKKIDGNQTIEDVEKDVEKALVIE